MKQWQQNLILPLIVIMGSLNLILFLIGILGHIDLLTVGAGFNLVLTAWNGTLYLYQVYEYKRLITLRRKY